MTIQNLIKELNQIIPFQQAEDFDNVGLLCGNPEREITGVLICHDALESVVEEAVQKNANVILTFHPIIFSGLKSITGKNYVEKAVLKAIENKIAIIALHTALDNHYFGVNHRICRELGLDQLKILIPKKENLLQLITYVPVDYAEQVKKALFEAGAGNIGFYDECSFSISGEGTFRPIDGSNPFLGKKGTTEKVNEIQLSVIFEKFKKNQIISAMKFAHPYEEVAYQIYAIENENQYSGLGMFGELSEEMEEKEFLNFVKEKFDLKIIRHSSFTGKKIKKVAVLGGSGASGIKNALQNQCDAYLTADMKYHDFFRAEGQIILADIGHYESEQYIKILLFEYLSKKIPTFAPKISKVDTNPIIYYS